MIRSYKKFRFSLAINLLSLFFFSALYAQNPDECGLHDMIQQFWASGSATFQRPALQNEQTIGTTNFVIHYSLTDPVHATTLQHAQDVAAFAEESWSAVAGLSWELPPLDNGNGGDNRYDIYIKHTGSFLGLAVPEDPFPAPYSNGYSSWVEITKDPIPDDDVSEADRLRTLVAHEFHHACQLRYVLAPIEEFWFYENTSVLMEKVVYPGINYLQYRLDDAAGPLLSPEWAIDHDTDGYQYPGGLWALFLNEYYDDEHTVRYVWEELGDNPQNNTLTALDGALQEHHASTLTAALPQYSV